MFFDVSLPLNFIKVKIRASKYIANSMSDYNEGLSWSNTRTFDESEEADIVAK
jgi:hypothetical protein